MFWGVVSGYPLFYFAGCKVLVQNLPNELGGALIALVGQLAEELEIARGQEGYKAVDVAAGRVLRHR